MKYFRDGGGYYLDVGCSQLIADGKIKVKQGKEIVEVKENGLLFEDDTFLEADIVVCATGYGSMRDTVRRVIGEETANKMHTCWSFDKQGEIQTVWRNSGVPGFWLQVRIAYAHVPFLAEPYGKRLTSIIMECGNFFQARCYSRLVALQIQQIQLGLSPKNVPYPEDKENKDPRF